MSRTFRRNKGTGLAGAHYFVWHDETEEENYQRLVKYFGDGYSNWRGPFGAIKEETNRKVRADNKRQLNKIYSIDDYEDFDYNSRNIKKLKGYVLWSYI